MYVNFLVQVVFGPKFLCTEGIHNMNATARFGCIYLSITVWICRIIVTLLANFLINTGNVFSHLAGAFHPFGAVCIKFIQFKFEYFNVFGVWVWWHIPGHCTFKIFRGWLLLFCEKLTFQIRIFLKKPNNLSGNMSYKLPVRQRGD